MSTARLVAPLAGLLLALAGCSGDGKPKSGDESLDPDLTPSDDGSGTAAGDVGARPDWAVGDWWTYEVEFFFPAMTTEATIVVYGEDGGNWLVSTTDRTVNVLSEFGHYPTLGPWTKSNLEPTIHGALIPFFKWPLEDGKTWTDPYRDVPATWSAKASDVTAPGGTSPGFQVNMTTEDGQTLSYTYARETGWFTQLEYGFGGPAARLQLLDYGHDFEGSVSVLSFAEHVHRSFPALGVVPGTVPTVPAEELGETFTVSGEGSLVWAFYYGGAAGTYGLSFGPLSDQAANQGIVRTPQTSDGQFFIDWGELENAGAGEWGVMAGGVAQGSGFVFAEILEVTEATVTPG